MGADGSKIPSVSRNRGSRVVARWQKRQLPAQLFAVARHDERADALCALINGVPWVRTDDFAKWPFDPPLSDAGLISSAATSSRMSALEESDEVQIHIIISSPYYRCVQTAVEICRGLGGKTRLLIDRSLGEIYGPDIMGATEPVCPVRPMQHTLAYCNSRGVQVHAKAIGKWPIWPEKVRDARKRLANRFLTYLHRSAVAKRNFMLVTHADCVGACLSLMPSQAEHSVEMVDYGGLFFAKRQGRDSSRKPGPTAGSKPQKRGTPGMVSVLPCEDDDAQLDGLSPASLLPGEQTFSPDYDGWLGDTPGPSWGEAPSGPSNGTDPESLWSASSIAGLDSGAEEEDIPGELPRAADGWQVCTSGIQLRSKAGPSSSGRINKLSKTMKTLTQGSQYSRHHIEKLLGELSDRPLIDDREVDVNPAAQHQHHQQTETFNTLPTTLSMSTFIFGSSDVAFMSECGSDACSATLSRIPTIDDRIPTVDDLDPGGQLPGLMRALEGMPGVQRVNSLDGGPRSQRSSLVANLASSAQATQLHHRLSADRRRSTGSMGSGSPRISGGTGGLDASMAQRWASDVRNRMDHHFSPEISPPSTPELSPKCVKDTPSEVDVWGVSRYSSGTAEPLIARLSKRIDASRRSSRAQTLDILERVDEKEASQASQAACPDKKHAQEQVQRASSDPKMRKEPIVIEEKGKLAEKGRADVPLGSSLNSALLTRRAERQTGAPSEPIVIEAQTELTCKDRKLTAAVGESSLMRRRRSEPDASTEAAAATLAAPDVQALAKREGRGKEDRQPIVIKERDASEVEIKEVPLKSSTENSMLLKRRNMRLALQPIGQTGSTSQECAAPAVAVAQTGGATVASTSLI